MAASGAIAAVTTVVMAFAEKATVAEAQQPLDEVVLPAILTMEDAEHADFFDDNLQLLAACTTRWITEPMWRAFEALYHGFRAEGVDYFPEIMPAVYNYVCNGKERFSQVSCGAEGGRGVLVTDGGKCVTHREREMKASMLER